MEDVLSGCKRIKITNDMIKAVSQFNSAEELLRSGGISIETLDRAAHGFSESDITTLKPSQLNIKWHTDMLNPIEQIKRSGLSKVGWAKTVSLDTPIDVSYKDGKFWIEDGHHRYTAAKILNKALNVKLEIKDNPIKLMGKGMGYDNFHKCIFNRVHND
jgi:hypothetical protein